MVKSRYAPGDWFAVPLLDGESWAVGVVARERGSAVVGYFFGPRFISVPTLVEVGKRSPEDAILCGRFSFLGLRDGKWVILGRNPAWDPSEWPMPRFFRHEPITGRVFERLYDGKNPGKLVGERRVSAEEAERGVVDSSMGALFVENKLSKLLGVESAGGVSR